MVEAQNRLDVKAKKSIARKIAIKNSQIHYGGNEKEWHKNMKTTTKAELEAQGYAVTLEKFIIANGHRYAVDLYAQKDNEVLIYEFGECPQQRFNDLTSQFPQVFHIPIIVKRLKRKWNKSLGRYA